LENLGRRRAGIGSTAESFEKALRGTAINDPDRNRVAIPLRGFEAVLPNCVELRFIQTVTQFLYHANICRLPVLVNRNVQVTLGADVLFPFPRARWSRLLITYTEGANS
jgi:hypothetical protein